MDKSWILFLHSELEQFLTCKAFQRLKKRDKCIQKRRHWGVKPGLKTRWHVNKGLDMETILCLKPYTDLGQELRFTWTFNTGEDVEQFLTVIYLSFFGFSAGCFLTYEEPQKKTFNTSLLLQWFNYEEELFY